jgi:hypothetical protein
MFPAGIRTQFFGVNVRRTGNNTGAAVRGQSTSALNLNASLSRPQKIGRASTDAVLVAVGTHLPFMSLDQPYHAAALYPIKCMGDVVPIEHG